MKTCLFLISINIFRNKRGFTDSYFGQPKFPYTLETQDPPSSGRIKALLFNKV